MAGTRIWRAEEVGRVLRGRGLGCRSVLHGSPCAALSRHAHSELVRHLHALLVGLEAVCDSGHHEVLLSKWPLCGEHI